MKSMNSLPKSFTLCTAVAALAALVLLPSVALAQEKGATKLMQLKPIKTVQDAQAVAAGDTVAMSCPKCKTIWVTVVEKSNKTGAKPDSRVEARHACPGCEVKLVTAARGKLAAETVQHTCKNCGSTDAFCCVMKKGEGATPGMDKGRK